MGKRLLTTMLALLLVSGSAAAHVRTKRRSHKAKAVATRQVAQDTVRTPPQPPSKPIAVGDEIKGELGSDSPVNDGGQRADTYRFTGTTSKRIAYCK